MVTIKDIARRAGVSIGTVDRVLHNRGRVAEPTRKKIKRLVARLGYRPNIFGSRLSLAKSYTFGVLMPKLSQDGAYWRLAAEGMDQAARELSAFHLTIRHYLYDRFSRSSFERTAGALRSEKPDGLCIAPVTPSRMEPFLQTLPHGFPYVFFDSDIPTAHPVARIGQDPYQSGILAGSLFDRTIAGTGTVAVVRVYPGAFHINARAAGCLSYFTSHHGLKAVQYDLDPAAGGNCFARVFDRMFLNHADLRGIFVTTALVHRFAALVTEHKQAGMIRLIGYDIVKKNIPHIRDGTIDFIISQRPKQQGYRGIYSLYRHTVLRDPVPPAVIMPLDIVTRENLEYYT